jgi:hypothetical protein
MPIQFPYRDPETGEWSDVDYYTAAEVAQKLHVSRDAVWKHCASGEWPHMRVLRRYFLNADQIGRVIDLMTVDPQQVPLWEPVHSLGMVLDPDDDDDTAGAR